jgi:lauroyl/myristoyl acyltransferase
VVVRESYDPRLDPLVDAHRVAHGLEVIHRGHPGAAARTLRALRRCRPVGFLIDLESRVPSVSLPFLGAPTRIPLGPQRLCQITGARLLVATLHRRLGPEREPPQFDLRITAVVGNDAMDLTLRASRLLEKAVLARPEDWLWMA